MGVEKTVTTDSKSDGGVIDMTQKSLSMLRWYLTSFDGTICSCCDRTERSGVANVDGSMKDVTEATMCRDENYSQALYNHVVNNMTNSFCVKHYQMH